MRPIRLTLFMFTFLALLVGCGSAGEPRPVASTATPIATTAAPGSTVATSASNIQIAVATDDFLVGRPRVPFILFAGTEQVADAQQVTLTAYDLSSGTPVAGWVGEATNYSDYAVPYWIGYPEMAHAGNWGLNATITLADGTVTNSQFAIAVKEESAIPAIGGLPPASENRTLTTEPDIKKLTSDPTAEPALYQMTIAEALASGRPTVVTFATPAFCETALCSPVVDNVQAVYDELGEQVNFIHIEIYKTFDPLEIADEVNEWGLTSEPWTFVLDEEGLVVARLGGPVSFRELTEELSPLLP